MDEAPVGSSHGFKLLHGTLFAYLDCLPALVFICKKELGIPAGPKEKSTFEKGF